MHVKREQVTPTNVTLTITADQAVIDQVKQATLQRLGENVKVAGFRPGKAPANLIEKQIDQSIFQTEFLEQAVNHLYVEAAQHEKLRPVSQPEIAITKFVPFTTLEFTASVESVGDIVLPDYKKITVAIEKSPVTATDVNAVVDNLLQRAATKQPVKRAAKNGDEVVIDFHGTDAKTKADIAGADGSDYALVLGSKSFIPGFEDELVGMKPEDQTEFTLTFPKDYAAQDLQGRKVTFAVKVHAVNEVAAPKLDDAFAASVGPFRTVNDLKADIKKQLSVEREQQERRAYENQLLEKIATKTSVTIPKVLVEDEIDRMEEEEKRNIVYRGQTWQEHLDEEKLTSEAHREKQRDGAEQRVKAGLVLGEIAEQEHITVSPDELDLRIELLKGQYTDVGMQNELDNPENRRDILNRMITEKTLDKLRSYARA